jgi:hypothetical protein
MRVTQAESWVSEEAMADEDPKRSLRDRRKETIGAWVGKVEGDWMAGAVTCVC